MKTKIKKSMNLQIEHEVWRPNADFDEVAKVSEMLEKALKEEEVETKDIISKKHPEDASITKRLSAPGKAKKAITTINIDL
ncbi:hypothetical protein H5410_033839 [Solanum commersonii]|uniref:Uncharacterized protein n=1 Tax=Solanum commersonii TaxID=4109 RepID=A0A9J5YRE6_SOLCO|nr:hypothetical protein H5410_033839 [Solanum commersonii]